MKHISTHQNTVYIELSVEEVDEIYNYVDLDGMDVEVFEGDNCLDVSVWDAIHTELDELNHHNQTTFDLKNGLAEVLNRFKKEYALIEGVEKK